MRSVLSSVVALLALLNLASIQESPRAAEPAAEELPSPQPDDTIIVYRRTYVNEPLADLGARLYDRVDQELRLRRLEADIKLLEAVLQTQRERAWYYDKYFGRTSALMITRQNAHLDVLATELRLRELRREKLLLLQYRPEATRYRQLVLESGGWITPAAP